MTKQVVLGQKNWFTQVRNLFLGRRKDGFTYVLYLNGGHPTWTVADYLGNCARTLVWSISMLNPWFLTKALVRKLTQKRNVRIRGVLCTYEDSIFYNSLASKDSSVQVVSNLRFHGHNSRRLCNCNFDKRTVLTVGNFQFVNFFRFQKLISGCKRVFSGDDRYNDPENNRCVNLNSCNPLLLTCQVKKMSQWNDDPL